MRIAARTGCTLEELGERMSAEEFGLWLAFTTEEPLAEQALDVAVARIRASLANGPLKPPQGKNGFAPLDFYAPRWQPPEAAPPAPAPLTAFRSLVAAARG